MKLYLIYLLFFIPNFNSFCNGKIATTEILTLGDQLYVKISVGNPGVDYNLRLQFASTILWFKPKKKSSSKSGNPVNKEGISGTNISDTIKVKSFLIIFVHSICTLR
uniref:Uncharacterized protein n=1 Tax=Meloidogyne enterolobii TaxID=390850 RepID=A0A6V7VLY4_MELEN|nr:unnamed protein product [Meloidogyne enterolobii]